MPPLPFPFDADNLALDLLNTAPSDEGRRDLLASPDAVAAWLAAAGLADLGARARLAAHPPLARVLATETWALRDAVGAAVEAFRSGSTVPAPAVFALDRTVAALRTGRGVEEAGRRLAWREEAEMDFPLGLLAPVAASAVELLATGSPARVRRCAEATCGLWFCDVSRNGRRRWCSMARCGNRSKVAAHYRRKREG